MENVDIEQRVISFLSDFASVSPERINISTSIVEDLNIEGDDAIELFEDFGRKFGVDVSSISISEYFPSEASFSPFDVFWSWILGKNKALKMLRVADFVDAAKSKEWRLSRGRYK